MAHQLVQPTTMSVHTRLHERQTLATDQPGALTQSRAHVVLIVAISCACVSLTTVLIVFRWFALMKRSFRHHLIMLLMLSDTFKAVWYLVFPIVIFTTGQIESSSNFCQAGGFFIAFATEASDFASLMLAFHLALCVFGPSRSTQTGGLYTYRKIVYTFWILLPILAASLAFVNSGNAYVTYGTICYLPRQPIWYRLALAWIPRYIIMFTLFSVGLSITIYVHLNFKRFSLVTSDSLQTSQTSRRTTLERAVPFTDASLDTNVDPLSEPSSPVSGPSQANINSNLNEIAMTPLSSPLPPTVPGRRTPTYGSRRQSKVSFASVNHNNSIAGYSMATATGTATEELDSSRQAIQRQLRLLFIWPTTYLLVWLFPFISQCLQYTSRYSNSQPYWLSITVTAILASQAGIDALVFSFREKPWKRPRGTPLISKQKLRQLSLWPPEPEPPAHTSDDVPAGSTAGSVTFGTSPKRRLSKRISANWWEAEGRKRKDSIWMGTDVPPVPEDDGGVDEEANEQAIADSDDENTDDETTQQSSSSEKQKERAHST